MKKYIKLGFLLLLTVFSTSIQAQTTKKSIQVIASFSILADVIEQIGKEKVEVHSIVPVDVDAHEYQISPDDIKKLKFANLFILNGLGFEGWQTKLIEAANFKGQVLEVSEQGIDLIHYEESAHNEPSAKKHENHDEHDHGMIDPHVWQNPQNVMVWVKQINNALAKISPENTAYFQKNTDDYLEKLTNLDKQAKEKFQAIPKDKRKILMSHDAFAYFSSAYDIKIYSIRGVNPKSEASAQDIKNIVALIKKENIKVVFNENIQVDRMIQSLQQDYKLRIGSVLYTDALSKKEGAAPNYIALIQSNIQTISEALSH